MAKDKKSFVLYADLIDRIEHLTNEEKGLLFQHLLEYVNDKEPVLEDRILIGVWKPIEQQLKRDLKKFEQVKIKRSEAGKRSAELRALKKDKQTLTNSTSVESVQQTSTNPTVNDNVNVNVNDNVNVINKKSKLKFTKTNFKKELLDLGVDENHLEDWLRVRTAKKCVFTKTALNSFLLECKKNNFSIPDAVRICAENSWAGFKVEWFNNLKNNQNGKSNTKTQPTINRQTEDVIRQNSQGWERNRN